MYLDKSQASEELKFWNWRGEQLRMENFEEDEEGEVIEDYLETKDEL